MDRRFGENRRQGFGGGNRGGFRRNNFHRGPREMHKAVCSECGKDCEVPFKPTEGKPVFCRDCFIKKKKAEEEGSSGNSESQDQSEDSDM